MYFKGVYCIINATLGLRRDGGRAILVSESGSLSCLVCFHFKLIILSNSLCLHYSLIPLSSLIKRAFIFSLIFIYLFIYYAFRHKTASACVESKLLIFSLSLFFFHYSNDREPTAQHSSQKWSICSHPAVGWPGATPQAHSFWLCMLRLTYTFYSCPAQTANLLHLRLSRLD